MAERKDSQNSTNSVDSQGNIVRAGSLRKKAPLFGGWKPKFAVLEDRNLSIYRDDKLKKCELQITLTDDAEILSKPPKSQNKSPMIEIIEVDPHKKSKKKVFVFKTKDEADQRAWVSTIQGAIDKDKVEVRVFGISLQKLGQNPDNFDLERGLPFLVAKSVEFLKRGDRLTEEGVFRLAGNFERINELKEEFNSGKNPNFEDNEDVNVVTGLFKQYFGSLPEPLLLTSNYERLIAASRDSEHELLAALSTVIRQLPVENSTLLKYLCEFLQVVAEKAAENKMGVKNLATVFGPNILKGKSDDPMKLMAESDLVSRCVEYLITHLDKLFDGVPLWTDIKKGGTR